MALSTAPFASGRLAVRLFYLWSGLGLFRERGFCPGDPQIDPAPSVRTLALDPQGHQPVNRKHQFIICITQRDFSGADTLRQSAQKRLYRLFVLQGFMMEFAVGMAHANWYPWVTASGRKCLAAGKSELKPIISPLG